MREIRKASKYCTKAKIVEGGGDFSIKFSLDEDREEQEIIPFNELKKIMLGSINENAFIFADYVKSTSNKTKIAK